MNRNNILLVSVVAVVIGAMSYYIFLSAPSDVGQRVRVENEQASLGPGQYVARDLTHEFRIIETSPQSFDPIPKVLGLNGSWKKETITVWIEPDKFGREYGGALLQDLMDPVGGWNAVLHEKRDQYGKIVPVLVPGDSVESDIVIFLREPTGELSKARLLLQKETIVRVEIIVVIDEISNRELTMAIANHELGHALGLGHSSDSSSIMSQSISIVDGSPAANIGSCESKSLEQVYVKGNLLPVIC